METQKYTININLQRKINSTKMNHFNLLVSVILLFRNERYRKTIQGKKEEKTNKNKREMELIATAFPPFTLFRSII